MPLRAASSVMAYSGGEGCPGHQRPVTKKATKNTEAEYGEFVISCGVCESALIGNELFGPADRPAPLTKDEAESLEAQQKSANMNILEGLASLPQFAQVLDQLVKTVQGQDRHGRRG